MKNKVLLLLILLINGAGTMQATRSLPFECKPIISKPLLYFKYPWHYAALTGNKVLENKYYRLYQQQFNDKPPTKYALYKTVISAPIEIISTTDCKDTPFHYAALGNQVPYVDENGTYLKFLDILNKIVATKIIENNKPVWRYTQPDISSLTGDIDFNKKVMESLPIESKDGIPILPEIKIYYREYADFPGFDLSFVDVPNLKGYTPLHYAAMMGSDKTIEWLLDLKDKDNEYRVKSTSATNDNKYTPLVLAVKAGRADTVSLLIKKEKERSGCKNDAACKEIVFSFLDQKSVVLRGKNASNQDLVYDGNIFYWAAKVGNEKVLQALLDAIGSLGIDQKKILLNDSHSYLIEGNKKDLKGISPLMVAVVEKHPKIVRLLLNQEGIIDLSGGVKDLAKSPHEVARNMSGPAAREIEGMFWDIKNPFVYALQKQQDKRVISMLDQQPGLAFDWVSRDHKNALKILQEASNLDEKSFKEEVGKIEKNIAKNGKNLLALHRIIQKILKTQLDHLKAVGLTGIAKAVAEGFKVTRNPAGYLYIQNSNLPIMQTPPIVEYENDHGIYTITLMPTDDRMNRVFDKLLALVKNTDLKNYIYEFSIDSQYLKILQFIVFPRIIIYPILGKNNAQKALDIIYNAFKKEKGLDKGLQFYAKVTNLIYIAQGQLSKKESGYEDYLYEAPQKVYYSSDKVKPADGTHYLVHPGTKKLITGKKVSELPDDKGKADEE